MVNLKFAATGRPFSTLPFFFIILTSSVIISHLRPTSCYTDHPPKLRDLVQDFLTKIEQIVEAPPPSLAQSVPRQIGGVFYPVGYGADPTGHNDSSDAIQRALNDAFVQLNDENLELMPGVKDKGGAVIDLQGGSYRISKPITFPPAGGGNVVIKEGSLRASQEFPPNRFLVELISQKSEVLVYRTDDVFTYAGDAIYYEDITFRDMLLDSGSRGSGLAVVDTARVRIMNSYFLNFTSQGIFVQGGHETYISTCFLGQHPGVGKDRDERSFTGTAIDMMSDDNVISDIVAFSSHIGVQVRGRSNMLSGVHTYNKLKGYGGVGILVKKVAVFTRLDNCFLDYNPIVLEDPQFVHLTNSFFYGDANVVLKSVSGQVESLTITNNYFFGYVSSSIVEIDGYFDRIEQVIIEDNQSRNTTLLKSTSAKLTVAGNGTRWVANFNEQLVFPNRIKNFQYSVLAKPGQGRPGWIRATDVSWNKVVVESEEAIDAVVSFVVDQ